MACQRSGNARAGKDPYGASLINFRDCARISAQLRGMAAESRDDPADGEAINEYRLHETLGEGSFGLVRRASQVHADGATSHVAIKTMSKKRLKRKVKMSRQGRRVVRSSELDTVRREIAVQRKLQHANVLRLVDALDVEDSDDLHMGE